MSDADVTLTEAERKPAHRFPADEFRHRWYREDDVKRIIAARVAAEREQTKQVAADEGAALDRAEAAEQDAFQWRSRAMLDATERDVLRRKVAAGLALPVVHIKTPGYEGLFVRYDSLRAALASDTPEETE